MDYPSEEKALDTPDLKFHESADLRVYDDGQSAETLRDDLHEIIVVASANLRLQDYLGSAQSVQRLREQFPDLTGTEVGGHAATYLRALVPELRITPGDGPQTPPHLKVLGHPGQTYVL